MTEKVEIAREKMCCLLKKCEVLGLNPQLLAQRSNQKLDHDQNHRTMVHLAVVLVVFAVGFGLQSTAWNIYQDWRDGVRSDIQCAVQVPDAINRALRPPVACSMCDNVTQIDKISKVTSELFENEYAYGGKPIIILDATDDWTALDLFSYDFFREIYEKHIDKWLAHRCQFFPYQTNFKHLGEFLNLTKGAAMDNSSPWYVGWSNCDVEVTEILREHYSRPYFLPTHAEGKRLDWIFMGSKGYGAPMHVDNVEYPSWQAQLKGRKKWRLQPPPECFYSCTSLEVVVEPGETIVVDTNRWYHSTEIVSDELSITIGAEYD